MKKILPLLGLFLTMLACSIPQTVTPPPVTTAPPPLEPPTEETVQVNATCNELSFYLDPALAASYTCETVPASNIEFEIYPQYTNVTLQGYVLSGTFFTPHISVFPVAAYSALRPDYVPGLVAELQTLTAGGAPGPDALPLLPLFNAAQTFHAQYRVAPFQNGSGIRFLTLYAQYFAPVNNHDMFYTYQALTSDGQYWISVILPVNHAMLPPNADNPPGGQTWEQFSDNYELYITDMVNQLNAQPPESFLPSLALLDALAQSIIIQP